MQTPNITLAQIVATIMAAIHPILTLAGIELTAEQADALRDLADLAIALVGADAAIRIGRAFNTDALTRRHAAGEYAPSDDALAEASNEDPDA